MPSKIRVKISMAENESRIFSVRLYFLSGKVAGMGKILGERC